jgi:hypothetical protein
MNCRDVENMLTAYHEGRLAPEQRAELEQHLGSCQQCRAAEQQFRQVHERLVGFFEKHKLPADFDSAVLSAIGAGAGQEPSRRPVFTWRALAVWGSIAAAAALGLTLILASMWQVREVTVSPGSTATAEKSTDKAVERERSRTHQAEEENLVKNPVVPNGQPRDIPRDVEVAGRNAGSTDEEKLSVARKEASKDKSPEDQGGHGRPANAGEGLLASPQDGDGGPGVPPGERRKHPNGQKVGPRRPGQNRRNGEGDARRDLAERIRKRREAGRENEPPEAAKLEPEERRKLGSSIKECTDKGVPPAIAARVMRIVLKKGLTADDACKALRGLSEAVGKGIRPGLFAGALERVLNSMPEGASFDRALRRLVESLGSGEDKGKTN